MSNKVIKFPNTPANQLSETAKLAMEMETEKKYVSRKYRMDDEAERLG